MRGRLFSIVCCAVFTAAMHAAQFTPLEWQQRVKQHTLSGVADQLKHTTWIRDRNRNFIDDEIETRFGPDELVDVFVNLNQCLSPRLIHATFGRFGKVTYISKTITFLGLARVRVQDLEAIAAMPEVAMVEWQVPGQLMNDVSARAIQARTSSTYSPNTTQNAGFNGTGVTIAVLDSGVDDAHETFTGALIAGFDALDFEDTNGNGMDDSCEPPSLGNGSCADANDEPGNGTNNPPDPNGHGTHVSGIALGRGAAGRICSNPDDGSTPTNCSGVASGARLADVRVATALGGVSAVDVAEAIDWITTRMNTFNIRAANLSFGFCTADDGTSAMAQQVNYAAAVGIAMVVAHGNAVNCGVAPGTVLTIFPGSASFAMTVGGTNDMNTVSRANDTNYSQFMRGPRNDFSAATPNLLALKPDISAPGQNILSATAGTAGNYNSSSGTSMAAPQVAGATAVLRQAIPAIDPGGVKHLLKARADTTLNTAQFPAVDPVWDNDLGAGMLNVGGALGGASVDVRFPNCTGPSSIPGQPCTLSGGQPPWNNIFDITTATPPQVGVPNTITAQVRNDGAVAAAVLVNFGVYVFAAGNNQFFHIGTVPVNVPAASTVPVSIGWTPAATNHQCAQVSIDFGIDTNHLNNTTQRNLSVAPSVYEVRVENPFFVQAKFEVETRSKREGWRCHVAGDRTFTIDPMNDCPRNVRIQYNAPANTPPGERGDCEVAVFATPTDGSGKRQLIGGVTVQTYVPRPCRVVGYVRGQKGEPLAKAKLELRRLIDDKEYGEAVVVATDEEGLFETRMAPDYPYVVRAPGSDSKRPLVVRPRCGGPLHLAVTKEGLTSITYVPADPVRIEPLPLEKKAQ